jgi:anti-anti-sigma regulatory factor
MERQGILVIVGAMSLISGRQVPVRQVPEKLDVKRGWAFFREVEFCLKVDRPRLVLDCSKVQQLDRVGIQLLLRCLEEAMKRNGDVKLAAIPPTAATILKFAKVDHLFETFDNTADAVNSFYAFSVGPFLQTAEHRHSTLASGPPRNGFKNGRADSRRRSASLEVASELRTSVSRNWLKRQIAGCLVLLLVAPFAAASPSPQQEMNPDQQTDGVSSSKAQPLGLDNVAKKVNVEASQVETLPNSPGSVRSQALGSKLLSSGQQPAVKQEQNFTQEPEGTAVAQPVVATGVAASRPAGVAIAPAKQRRTRSILIKVGTILGAGVAVGTVVALSNASPSRPR